MRKLGKTFIGTVSCVTVSNRKLFCTGQYSFVGVIFNRKAHSEIVLLISYDLKDLFLIAHYTAYSSKYTMISNHFF